MFGLLLLLMAGLLAFPKETLSAAKDGALLWWTQALPALLPHLILSGLATRARPKPIRLGRLHPYALLSFLLGALGGYPTGARVLGSAAKDGAIREAEAQRFSYAAGLMSPAFLCSVTAIGLLQSAALIPALLLSVYPVALGALLLSGRTDQAPLLPPRHTLTASDVSDAISDGMRAMLQILGCIVLCRVLAAFLEALHVPMLLAAVLPVSEDVLSAVLMGLMEMTSGCAAIAALSLPLPVRVALCVFLQMFGGASILLQTQSVLHLKKPLTYLIVRLGMATVSALLAYGWTRLLPMPAIPAMASPRAMLSRMNALLSVLLPSALSLLSASVLAIWMLPRQKAGDKRGSL